MSSKNLNVKYANCILNKYLDYSELVVYPESFVCNYEHRENVERDTRRLFKDKNGIYAPNKEGATIQRLADSLAKSGNRALDMIKGYIQCNEWQYFITLTFSPKQVDRKDKKAVNYCWQKYKQNLQYMFPDIKILLVPELHKKGGIHFHGFIGNADLDIFLKPAKNNKKNSAHYGEYIYSESGVQIFNLTNFKYGFTTVAKIEKESSKLQLAYYLTKYVTKSVQSGVGYNQKRYYHTQNLDYKEKTLLFLHDCEVAEFVDINNATLVKDKNGIKTYHLDKHFLYV